MPPKPNPTLYSIPKTFMWFAIVSILLTGSLVAIIWLDYSREWKTYQKAFIELKIKNAQSELKAASSKIDKKKLADLEAVKNATEEALKIHRTEMATLQKEIGSLSTTLIKKKNAYQDLKQFQDSYRYFFEDYTEHKDPKAKEYEKKLAEVSPKVVAAKIAFDEAEKAKADKESALNEYLAKEKAAQKDLDKILDEQTRTQKKISKLMPSLAKAALNAPMLDFVAPTYKVQQIVLDNLYDDYHFAKTQKVDRCTTCHLGIDQKGYEDAPQPFKTHPNLDLYLGSSSPHQIEKVGCTSCHGGNGHSVSFKDSAHMPQSAEQAEQWHKKYNWEMLEKWDNKMLPMNYVQASCAKCHQQTTDVPKANKLNEGRALANRYGCINCHKISGYENRWKVGPSLESISSKLDKDWIVKWTHNPQHFRESTKMPRIFNLGNTSNPEDLAKNAAAIESIAVYLLKHSSPVTLAAPPSKGNAESGEKLIKERGCLGCHSLSNVQADHHAPELSGLGSKVKPEWLYSWVKNPKHFSPSTRMPNLRLTDSEAADITAYLLSQRNEKFESEKAPQADPAVRDALILEGLLGTLTRDQAQEKINSLKEDEKWEFLGKKTISQQGCYSCHQIKGFEDAKAIGAELTKEGRKDLHQFDFGFIDIEHTRHDWITQKLKEPRIFDHGKVKAYYEKLRMPQFNLTPAEIESITTFVLSLTDEQIPYEMQKRLSPNEAKVEKGRLLVQKLNCAGCHALDGKPGTLREIMEDKGQAPPVLDGEGAKVQEKWLHEFLKAPYPVRPWLQIHMPTFDLSEDEVKSIVEYFTYMAHQEISYNGLDLPETSKEKLEGGKVLFEKFQCTKCHQVNAEALAMGTSFLAPDLTLTKHRLKPEWVRQWLVDPQMVQEGTMMPTFFADGTTPVEDILSGDANKQIEAIRDYLYTYETQKS